MQQKLVSGGLLSTRNLHRYDPFTCTDTEFLRLSKYSEHNHGFATAIAGHRNKGSKGCQLGMNSTPFGIRSENGIITKAGATDPDY